MSRTVRLWGPVVLWMAAIFLVSSMSDVPLPEDLSDKSGPGLAYALLGGLMARAVAGGQGRPITVAGAMLAFLATVVYGVSDEIHQGFVPGRSPEVADLFADMVGGGLAIAGSWAWGLTRAPRRTGKPHFRGR